MKHLRYQINNLINDLELCIQGDLPLSLLPPTQLLSILSNINKKLPPGISLPLKLSNDHLLTFYKHLHTLVVPLDTRFHIVIALPLTMNNYQFTLYDVISMPYTPPDMNVSVQYSLEHT